MEDKPSLKLIFFSLFPKVDKITAYKLSFCDNIEKIKFSNKTHDIPEDIFKYGKDKTRISIELYNNNKKLNIIDFPILYGKNTIYLENEGDGKGLNFEIIFKNCENIKVTSFEKVFELFDNNNTKDRKKISILNYNLLSININSVTININKEIKNIPTSSIDFYQFSIINLQENKIIFYYYSFYYCLKTFMFAVFKLVSNFFLYFPLS